MRLQKDEFEEEPAINLTSLIDVVFLLLIFFMVSTTFERQTLLRVDLPEAATAETEEQPRQLELVITEDGEMYLDDQMLADTSRTTIGAALSNAFEDRPEAALIIRADGSAHHRLVVRAMDVATEQGITRLGIATVPEEDE